MTRLPRLFAVVASAAFAQVPPGVLTESEIRSLYGAGRWAEAAELASGTLARSADLDLILGLSLARLGRLDEAGHVLLDARRAHPSDPRFLTELAGVAYRRNDYADAKKKLFEALRLNPSDAYANTFLGTLFLLEDNLPAALKYWNRAGKPLIQDLRLEPSPSLQPLLRDRAFWISGGQIFTLERLAMTEANLNRLAVFSSYRFELTPREDRRYDLTFRSLEKGLPTSRWLAILPFAQGLPYQTVFIDLHNLGRRAIQASALARWDPDKRRLAGNLAGPVRLSPRLIYRVGFDARDENWDLRETYLAKPGGIDGMVLRKAEAGADLSYALNSRVQWTSGLWFARRDYRGADPSPFFRDGWSFQFKNSLAGRVWTRPENRLRVDGSAHLETGRLFSGPSSRLLGVRASATTVWLPQAKGDDWAVSARIGAGRLFGAPPFDQLFMLGMERDNDLWMRGHAGARDGRKGTAPIGTEYILLQTAVDRAVLKFPLLSFRVGPFFDTGQVNDPSGTFGPRRWMVDTGALVKITALGLTWTLVYGRDLRQGRGVFYTYVSR